MPKKSQISITPKLTNQSEIVLYQPNDSIHLEVRIEEETVWLNRNQLAVLFGRDIKTIGKHINNALHEELQDMATVAKFAIVQRIIGTGQMIRQIKEPSPVLLMGN